MRCGDGARPGAPFARRMSPGTGTRGRGRLPPRDIGVRAANAGGVALAPDQSRNCGGRFSRIAASASGRSADSSIAAFHVAT